MVKGSLYLKTTANDWTAMMMVVLYTELINKFCSFCYSMYHYPHWNRDRATINWQTALLSNGSKWVLLMMKIAILISALYKYYYYNYYRIRGVKGVAQWLVATKQLVLQQSNCQCSLSLTNLFRLIRKIFCLVLHKKRKMRISGFSFRKIMKPNIVIANSNLVPTRIL